MYDGKHDGHAEKEISLKHRRRHLKQRLLLVIQKHGSSRKLNEKANGALKEYMNEHED